MIIITTCTTYKLKREILVKQYVEPHPNRNHELLNYVYPVEKRILHQAYDIGNLKDDTKKSFIKHKFIKLGFEESISNAISTTILVCHTFLKGKIDRNETSATFRDVNRVRNMITFLCMYFDFQDKYENNKMFDDYIIEKRQLPSRVKRDYIIKAIYMAILINYVYRFYNKGKRIIFSKLILNLKNIKMI